MAILKPSPGLPSKLLLGIRQSSKISEQVPEARMPSCRRQVVYSREAGVYAFRTAAFSEPACFPPIPICQQPHLVFWLAKRQAGSRHRHEERTDTLRG